MQHLSIAYDKIREVINLSDYQGNLLHTIQLRKDQLVMRKVLTTLRSEHDKSTDRFKLKFLRDKRYKARPFHAWKSQLTKASVPALKNFLVLKWKGIAFRAF